MHYGFRHWQACAASALLIAVIPALRPQLMAQTDAQTIAFGTRHAVALRNNGDVLTWGDNVGCQLGRRSGNRSAEPTLVLRNIKEIAVAGAHSLALDSDGKVYGWGGDAGALGNADDNERCEGPEPVVSLEGKTVAHIATGVDFSLAVMTNGDLYCTGANDMGQCPAAKGRTQSFTLVPYPELAGKVAAVKAGAYHALVLTTDGRLYAFGRAREGQLGNGKTTSALTLVPDLTDVVSFAAGTWHSAAARADGSAWVWGSNGRSELCDGTTANRSVPARVELPGGQKITGVVAGGSTTLLRAADGTLYGCGDNQFGSLGADQPRVVPRPAVIAPSASSSGFAVAGGSYGAYTTDGCAVRLAGTNGDGIISATGAPGQLPFAVRTGLSLCAPRPAKPLATRIVIPPSGGMSGCWSPRVEEDGFNNPRFAPLKQAVLAAENLLRENKTYLAAPVPVRFRAAASAGPLGEGGAAVHIKAAPERKADRTRLWSEGCGVIPQIDRIGGAIGQISIFFNRAGEQFVSATGEGPKLTGRAGGYPEYNNWVIITKDGRLPWIPQTLADKLDAEGARRKAKLDEWKKSRSSMKAMDPAAAQKTYEMLKKTDPAGAERFLASIDEQAVEMKRLQQDVYPATTAQLDKEVADYEQYRASFTTEQLGAPAVWGDPTGAGKRKLDAEIAALQALTPAEQAQVDALSRESRDLERQAQAEAARDRASPEVTRLRAQANDRALQVRTIRQRHIEAASPRLADATAQYTLRNLRPGTADAAMSFKRDPAFPDFSTPNRIQVITVMFSYDPDPQQTERRAWQTRTKESFDFAALAKLLDR